tara:strand:- start:29 stop:232 length:204 start_codon:yes stop_codon:yes gene_type:complete
MQKIGDKIVTVGGCAHYFKNGEKAVLHEVDSIGSWWADFSGNKEYYLDGIWNVGALGDGFELDTTGE